MKQTWRPYALLAVLVCLCVAFAYLVAREIAERNARSPLHVTFFDVGQGDATFVESPSGTQVLIDGGKDGKVLEALPEVMEYFDRSIDVVIATHPDMDHIGGLVRVLERYDVGTLVMTDNVGDTPVYEAFMARVKAEGANVVYARRGHILDLGTGSAGSTTLAILFPDRSVRTVDSNTSSLVMRLSYGATDFLFMGDAPRSIETYLIALDREALGSEVLKLGHHGSRTSSDPAFVGAVRPRYGIVSAGKDNEYGHPHAEVLETLAAMHSITQNTAEEGHILFVSDGSEIWLE
jgi:competence protein ComEC